jgi:beta-lactamase superfamily II metal-dependent hydrolase
MWSFVFQAPRRGSAVAAALSVVVLGACQPFVVRAVSPSAVPAGGQIVVTGAGFTPTMVASLAPSSAVSSSSSAGLVTLVVVAAADDEATLRLPAATPPGRWDLVLRRDDAETRLVDALLVQSGALQVHFLDVGQGDATLVVGPDGTALLVDGGNRDAGGVVADAIQRLTGGRLDAVALTHTDADHLGGVVHVLRGDDGVAGTADDVVPATRWIGHPDALCDSQLCDEFRGLRARFDEPLVGDVLDLGGARVEVLGRDGDFGGGVGAGVDDENERSLTLKVSFGGRSVFIGGDLTGGGLGTVDVERAAAERTGPVDVLRANHHGSATSSSAGFLAALQPRVVVLSVGTDNAFCHPEPGVLERLGGLGATLLSTGAGMVQDADRCDEGATRWPPGARTAQGSIALTITADGELRVDDEPL